MFQDLSSTFKRMLTIMTTIFLMIAGVSGIGSSPGEAEVKNVIYFIGDGMGVNHIDWTAEELDADLTMNTFEYKAYIDTADYMGGVTDSAAAGTALACGVRTFSGSIGVYTTDIFGLFSHPMNLSELAIEMGLRTGVLTSDSTSGATPSAFSAHVRDRGEEEKISKQQLASDIDLVWGSPSKSVTADAIAASNNFNLATSLDDIDALDADAKIFGQFPGNLWATSNDIGPTLSEMTAKAIELLDSDEGFFLMVEGAHIDKHSHGNKTEDMMDSLIEFDKAVKIGLDFAKDNGDTLVIVTADHETGAIKNIDGEYKFTSGSHSDAKVPVLVYGVDSFIKEGSTVKNRELPVYVADKIGATKDQFPRQIYK